MTIIKRNGSEVQFDSSKIAIAIQKANKEVLDKDKIPDTLIRKITNQITQTCKTYNRAVSIEEIQDMVEDELIKYNSPEVAKRYIKYRYERELVRKSNTTDEKILSLIQGVNEELKVENSNKNPTIASVQRDYMAGEVSRDLTRRLLLPKDIVDAHDSGLIHFHDSDFYAQQIYNCCLVNLEDMLQNGTVISGTLIERPHSFSTACNIATQIIAQVASSQYGGQSISLAHLAPFVNVSRKKIKKKVIEEILDIEFKSEDEKNKYIDKITEKRVKEEVNRGVQMLQYQVITLMTTNGQAPFVTMFMYLNEAKNQQEKEDLALIIKEVLEQRYQGVKNEKGVWITPAFPKLIYVLEEDNIKEGTSYWDLTKLAAKCTARRMVPDYISEKIMLKNKIDKNGDGHCYPCMGCLDGKEVIPYKYKGYYYVESFEKMWKRMSEEFSTKYQSAGSLNLYIDVKDTEIFDTNKNIYVEVSRIIRNVSNEWVELKFNHGRTIRCTADHPFETINGVIYAKDLTSDDKILLNKSIRTDVMVDGISEDKAYTQGKHFNETLTLPNYLYNCDKNIKLSFISGLIDGLGNIVDVVERSIAQFSTKNKELALQYMYLVQSLGYYCRIYKNIYTGVETYSCEFDSFNELKDYLKLDKNRCKCFENYSKSQKHNNHIYVSVLDKTILDYEDYSYDVTTESEHFDVSGIYSHNCRSFLTPYVDENEEPKYYGRFNQGVVTVNLVDIGLSAKKDKNEFWKIFDERMEMCHKALQCRHERLTGTTSDVAPILWQYGAISRLKPGEKIDKLLHGGYSTISLGFAGLWECVYAMIGKKLTEPEGEQFGLEIMHKLNDYTAKWKDAEKIDYSLYGTPLESTTYKFSKCLQKRFGVIEGVTDKNYITNSYHIHVTEPIDAFTKLSTESKFQLLSPGGAISYIEVPNLENNLNAVLSVMQFIYDNILYAELNTKSDYCQVCGSTGEVKIIEDENGKLVWECPYCGNRDQTKLNVARRTCGYIGTQFWNQGRTQEIKERYIHL